MTMAMPQGNAVFPRSHVGFDSITSQIEKKLLKRGFQFNVICVGMWQPRKVWHAQPTDSSRLQVKPVWESPHSSIPSSHRT